MAVCVFEGPALWCSGVSVFVQPLMGYAEAAAAAMTAAVLGATPTDTNTNNNLSARHDAVGCNASQPAL